MEHQNSPSDDLASRQPTANPRWKQNLKSVVDYLISQWFIAGLGLAVGLAAAFPNVGKKHGYIAAQYTVQYVCIGLIFLITGLSVRTEILVQMALNWRLHLVTQVTSFLAFSSVVYGIVALIRASHTTKIDPIVNAGLILTGILPTTIASNIAMTRNAGGSVEAATVEVCIGNTLGTFLTPVLLSMYLQAKNGWGFIQPKADGGDGLIAIYKHMGQQLGISLFAPLIAGQIIQNLWKAQVRRLLVLLRLHIVGSVLLLLVIWSTFSDKFASHAFTAITHESVILICFLGVGLYGSFTALVLFIARLPFLGEATDGESKWKRSLRHWRFSKKETTAICFCAAAKGLVLGAPLVSILYGGYPQLTQDIMSIPIALYQGTQVLLAQLSVALFRRWLQQDGEDDGEEDNALPAKDLQTVLSPISRIEGGEKVTEDV